MAINSITQSGFSAYASSTTVTKDKNTVSKQSVAVSVSMTQTKVSADKFLPSNDKGETAGIMSYWPSTVTDANLSSLTGLWDAMLGYSEKNVSVQFQQANYAAMSFEELASAIGMGTTPETAAAAISETGLWGVNAVSTRIMDMAMSLSKGDSKMAEELRAAVQKGFAAVGNLSSLPQVCQDTYAEIMSRFDKWAETGSIQSSSGAESVGKTESVGEAVSIPESEDGTIFTSNFDQRTELYKKHRAMVEAYYAKEMEINYASGNPAAHISNKYKNPNSPYFRSDLTERERKESWDQERALLYGGRLSVGYYDPALRSVRNELTLSGETVLVNQRTRDQMEGAIQKLFADNDIVIPEGQSFRLSVDPYEYHISVLGLEDAELTEKIEGLLNKGKNGYNLYYHLMDCSPERFGFGTPEQYKEHDLRKSGLYQMVKDLTGLDVRTLERKDGALLTPDGKDLWQVIMNIAAGLPTGDGNFGADMSYYKPAYDAVARFGWTDGSGLALEYRDGSLYDIGTDYGYGDGQNDWVQRILDGTLDVTDQIMGWVDRQAVELQVQRDNR